MEKLGDFFLRKNWNLESLAYSAASVSSWFASVKTSSLNQLVDESKGYLGRVFALFGLI